MYASEVCILRGELTQRTARSLSVATDPVSLLLYKLPFSDIQTTKALDAAIPEGGFV